MSHELYTNAAGKTSMAYVGAKPWHGLGQELTAGASIETWRTEAGMDYTLDRAPVTMIAPDGNFVEMPERDVLYRSDTRRGLAVVSSRYKVVQPGEVLEFFGGLSESLGYRLETAGVLYGGATYWALAKTPFEASVGGSDVIRGYLMLATSCDGSMSTVARFVNTRVVCNNTLRIAVGEQVPQVKVTHRQKFDASRVRDELGLTDEAWIAHAETLNRLADTRVTEARAQEFLRNLFPTTGERPSIASERSFELFMGKAIGSDLPGVSGTAWGLLNAVTEYLDHHRGRSQDARLSEAWFGGGATMKQKALDLLTV
jgi:phage/plasmid-like protein (TIGR03299 family)